MMASADVQTKLKEEKVAIVGSGLIGRSYAMLFASAGYQVSLYDQEHEQVEEALQEILLKLKSLSDKGLARGCLSVQQQHARITGQLDMQACVKDAFFIQTNPPFYCPLLEIIPAPWTDQDVIVKTRSLMQEVGLDPVILKKEIPGFILNRIQYAIIGECYRLIEDDVISVEDCDKVMSSGLGTRYAFMGPFETAYLNAEGFLNYCDRYKDKIFETQNDSGPPRLMGGNTMRRIHDDVGHIIGSHDALNARRQWRDDRLIALAQLKKHANKKNS